MNKTKSILSIFLAFAVIFGFSSSALAFSNYEVYNMVHEECKNSKSEIEQHL